MTSMAAIQEERVWVCVGVSVCRCACVCTCVHVCGEEECFFSPVHSTNHFTWLVVFLESRELALMCWSAGLGHWWDGSERKMLIAVGRVKDIQWFPLDPTIPYCIRSSESVLWKTQVCWRSLPSLLALLHQRINQRADLGLKEMTVVLIFTTLAHACPKIY